MPRWSMTRLNWTPALVADTTGFAANGFVALAGGVAGQRVNIWEVKMSGLAAAGAPMQTILARDSTVGVTGTASGALIAALDPATAALTNPVTTFSDSGTKPQRSSTLKLLDLSFNAFGGLIRLQLPPEGPIGMLGTTASFGEVSISSENAGTAGLTSCHLIFETL
jgi:hypothetical protein